MPMHADPVTVDSRTAVAHFMPWSGIGGVEIATLRLVETTRDRFRHVAFCLADAASLRDAFEKLGVEVVTYLPPEPSLRHGFRFYGESQRVQKQIRQAGISIVHFADEKAAYHNSLAARLSGARLVCHLRVSYPTLSLRQKLCLRPVQLFLFVSREAMNNFGMRVPPSRARVIYDAVEIPSLDMAAANASVREELGLTAREVVIGMVARVSPQKDYFTLADAAASIVRRHPEVRFLIVGDNSLVELNRRHYEEVLEKLRQLNLTGSFLFTGHRTDVTRLIAAMDICVLCTHREGFPLSILETMAMKKALVASSVGGIPEIVDPDVTGYLHQHEDSDELAAILTDLIEDPQKSARIGAAAYEHVRSHYSREKYAAEISQAYADVLAR